MRGFKEKRMHERAPFSASFQFTILFMQSSELNRIDSNGEIIDASLSGIGIRTVFPLEEGHIIEWDDEHQKGNLHIAMVKWSQKLDSHYRAGLKLI